MQIATSVDIMKSALAKDGMDAKAINDFIVNLAKGIKAKTLQVVQIYKTVFVISTIKQDGEKLPPKVVDAFPMTIEPDQLPIRLQTLPKTLKHMGFHGLRLPTDDENDVQMSRKLFPKASVKKEPGKNGQQMYVIEMRL